MNLPPNSIIASGPVIIENDKVLLNRERKGEKISPWFFPGGEVENFAEDLTQACRREVKEEMGIDIEIIKPLNTTLRKLDDNSIVVLVHYLAKRIGEINPGSNIVEWDWHDMRNLPENCAPNVFEVIKGYLGELA